MFASRVARQMISYTIVLLRLSLCYDKDAYGSREDFLDWISMEQKLSTHEGSRGACDCDCEAPMACANPDNPVLVRDWDSEPGATAAPMPNAQLC